MKTKNLEKVKQIKRKSTTELNEIANNPLEKRNKEYYENLNVERHGNKSFTNKKNMTTSV